MKTFRQILKKAIILFLIMILLCGVLYPLIITGIDQLCFREKANGSIIQVNGVKYGSGLLGQQFTDESHMWGRIMIPDVSTYQNEKGDVLFYARASNKSPASEEYSEEIEKRVELLKTFNPDTDIDEIPVELVTCSGSGLDPHISPAAAEYQIPRIAKENHMSQKEVRELVEKYTDGKLFGILGEKTVNVLKVNLALEGIL